MKVVGFCRSDLGCLLMSEGCRLFDFLANVVGCLLMYEGLRLFTFVRVM